jgi:nucleoside-diphosphate-sugar epimerase
MAVVSGGAGFIGSHLGAALLERGLPVLCLDNLSTGSADNLAAVADHPRFRFRRVNVTDPAALAAVPELQGTDPVLVFHLASPASVVDYLRLPLDTLRVNSMGTWALLDVARAVHGRFLLASTSEVYGDPLVHPQRETYWGNVNPNGVRSCYDESKRFAEALTAQYDRSYGLDTRIVRIFNTYGPHSRLDDGRIVPNFVGQALRGEPLTIYGDGSQTRSFCYVSDLVEGLLAVMLADGLHGEVFNLGNPHEQTVLQFAHSIARLAGHATPNLAWQPLPEDDPTRRQPDISKARALLGWEPRVDLDTGLARTMAWFRTTMTSGRSAGSGERAGVWVEEHV